MFNDRGTWVPLAAIMMVSIFIISTAVYYSTHLPKKEYKEESKRSQERKEDMQRVQGQVGGLSTGESVTIGVPSDSSLSLASGGSSPVEVIGYDTRSEFAGGWADENISCADGGLKLDNFIGNRFTMRSWYEPHEDVSHELDETIRKISLRFTAQRSGTVQNAAVFGYVYQSAWYGGPDNVDNYNIWIENDVDGLPGGVTNGSAVMVGLSDYYQTKYQGQWVGANVNAEVIEGETYHLLVQKVKSYQDYFDFTPSASLPFNTNWENNSGNENRGILTYARNVDSPAWVFEHRDPTYVLEYSTGDVEGNPYHTTFTTDWDGEYGYGGYKGFWQYYYAKVSENRYGDTGLLQGENFTIDSEVTINAIDMYVGRGPNTPDGDLYVALENADGVIEDGLLARPADVGETESWIRYTLSQTRTLSPGRYWVYLASDAYYYDYYSIPIDNAENAGQTNPYGALTYGGIDSYHITSDDSGATWTSDQASDIAFALVRENQYPSQGTYISEVIDAGKRSRWLNIGWDATEYSPVSAQVEGAWVRTGQLKPTVNPNWPDEPDLSWSPWMAVTNGVTISDNNVARYLQFKIKLVTGSIQYTPVVNSVTVRYTSGTGVTPSQPSLKWVQTTSGDFNQGMLESGTENVSAVGGGLTLQSSTPAGWTTLTGPAEGTGGVNGHRISTADGKVYYWVGVGPGTVGVAVPTSFGSAAMNPNYYEYDPAGGWSATDALPDVPFTTGSKYSIGTGEAVDPSGNPAIYAITGTTGNGSMQFARWTSVGGWVSLNAAVPWSVATQKTRNGCEMVWDNADSIYMFPGSGYSYDLYDWYKYSISGNSWTAMTDDIPGTSPGDPKNGPGNGAAFVTIGADKYIYIQFGHTPSSDYTSAEFWRYALPSGPWEQMTKHQYGADDGCDLVWDGSDYLYNAPGAYMEGLSAAEESRFLKYSISADVWQELEAVPTSVAGGLDDGGAMVMIGGTIYVFKGGSDDVQGGGGTSANDFYSYGLPTYKLQGTYISELFDAGQEVAWESITFDNTTFPGTDITFYVRFDTGTDPAGWTQVSTDNVLSASSQYIRYRADLTTTSDAASASLNAVTAKYTPSSVSTSSWDQGDWSGNSGLLAWGDATRYYDNSDTSGTISVGDLVLVPGSGSTYWGDNFQVDTTLASDTLDAAAERLSLRFRARRAEDVYGVRVYVNSYSTADLAAQIYKDKESSPGEPGDNLTEDNIVSITGTGWLYIGFDSPATFVKDNTYHIVLRSVTETETENWWTQTDWVGGPQSPLQVGTWLDTYDIFYENTEVDWSWVGRIRAENETGMGGGGATEDIAATGFELASDPIGFTQTGAPDDPATDYWGRTASAADAVPNTGSYLFAAQDMSTEGYVTFNSVDVSSYDNVWVSVYAGSNAGGFEGNETYSGYVSVDGGAYTNFFSVADPDLIAPYTNYTYNVGDSASTVQIRIYFNEGGSGTGSNTEVFWLDDVAITGNSAAPTLTYENGWFISSAFDATSGDARWNYVDWGENKPTGTDLTVYVRFENTPDPTGWTTGQPSDGGGTPAWQQVTNQQLLDNHARYAQYAAKFTATDNLFTAELENIRLRCGIPRGGSSGSWTQTTWVGGGGQTAWSDSTMFDNFDSIDWENTPGSLELVEANVGTENYGNPFRVDSTVSTIQSENSDNKIDIRFTAQASKTVENIRVYIADYSLFPTLKAELQTDSSGYPSGTKVSNGADGTAAVSATGWLQVAFSAPLPTLTAGTVYHLVVWDPPVEGSQIISSMSRLLSGATINSTSFELAQASDPIGYTQTGAPDDPATDYWGRVASAADAVPNTGSYLFAAQDMSTEGYVTFNSVSVSGYNSVVVSVYAGSNAGGFEGNETYSGYVSVNGGAYTNFFSVADPDLIAPYTNYTYNVSDGSSTVQIRIYFNEGGGGTGANTEVFWLDDVSITGTLAAGQWVSVDNVTDGTKIITALDGSDNLKDADENVRITLGEVPTGSPVVYYDNDATPNDGESVTASGSGTSWSAIIPASSALVKNGDTIRFSVWVDGTYYYRTGTTPWEFLVAAEPRNIHLTWDENNTSSTIVVTWETTLSTDGDNVLYDTVSRGGDPALYTSSATGSNNTYTGASGYIHDTKLTGLSANTVYYFVCGGVDGGYSNERSFRTAPDTSTTITFVAGGDSRSGSADWPTSRDNISIQMAKFNPSFVLFGGDFVLNGDNQAEWNTWFTDVENNWVDNNGLSIPIVPTVGNHEENAQNYYGQFYLPENENWYSLDYGPDLHLVVLSSQSIHDMATQTSWLDNDLAAHENVEWMVAIFHEPPYTSGNKNNRTDIQAEWNPVFDQYDVDLVIAGHDHTYERTVPIYGGAEVSTPENGTTYVVSGGWGAPLYPVGSNWWTAYSQSSYNHVVVEIVEDNVLNYNAYDENGIIIDSFSIIPLKVSTTTPADGATDVAIGQNVVVQFSKTMDTGITPTLSQTLGTDPGGWTFSAWSTTDNLNDTATWTHSNWTGGDSITMMVSNYQDTAGNVGADNSWSFTTAAAGTTATATGPTGTTNNTSQTLTYTTSGTPTSVKLYYTTNGGTNWNLAGEDASVDGSYAYTIASGDGTYGWIAVAIGGGSVETDPPTGGTAPEASSLVLDTQAPTNVGCSTPANSTPNVDPGTALVALTATDSGSGLHATPYYIELATNTAFTTGVQNSTWQAGTSWTPTLAEDTTYYWRVKARDAATNESSQCGDPDTAGYWSFSTPAYTYVTSETVTEGEGDPDGTPENAQADDGTYEILLENNYPTEGAGGGPENRAVDLQDSADDTLDLLADAQSDEVSGASPSAIVQGDGWYTADKADVMHFDSIDTSGMGGTLTLATLWVQYSVEAGYDGTTPIEWATDEAIFTSTGIVPTDGDVDRTVSYDLYAQGVDTVAELEALDIRFINGQGAAPKAVSFDYVWVEVTWSGGSAPAYRENIQHNVTGIPAALNYALQVEYYTSGDSENHSLYIYNFTSSGWDNAGNLEVGAGPFTFENTVDSDHISGAEVRVQFVQPDNDSTQTSLMIDYTRVKSWGAAGATATATGPVGSDNNTSQTLTYDNSGSPTSVKLYYTTNGGTNWNLAGEDASVDGSYAYTITSGDGTYGWIAVAIGGGSVETDPPTGGTSPEAGTFILDTAVPTVSSTSPENAATDVPMDNNVVVVFSETMDTTTEPTLTQTLGTDPGGWTFSGWTTTTNPNDTATWTHANWSYGDSITMQVNLYRDNALNVGAENSWSFTTPAGATATATGPLGSDNTASQTLTYDNSGSPTSVKLYYTTNGGTNWNLAGEDASVDGSYAYTITSGDGTYGWIAVAIGGGSVETDPPTGGTAPEAGTFILDTAVPTVSETSPADTATDVPMDNNVVVVFSETMDTTTEPTLTQTLGTDPGGWTFSGWTTTTNPNDTATWTHSAWTGGDSVTMQVELYRDNALNVGASSSWSFTTSTAATANATGPLGSDNTASQTLTYTTSGTPTSVKLYYTTNGGTNWNLAGEDASVDGSYAYTIVSGDGTYGWIAVAIGGGSVETDPPTGGTAPEAGTFILDTALPTVSETSPTNGATDVPVDNSVVVVFSETMDTTTEPTLTQTLGTDPGGWALSGWTTTTNPNDTATWTHANWSYADSVTMQVELYRDNALNVGASSSWSFTTAPEPSVATATGPLGSDNTTTQTLTYDNTGAPDNVKLYYTTDGGTNWTLADTDTTVDGSHSYTITSGDNTYSWIAVAIGAGSSETDPPPGGTSPEAGTFILDTAVPTVSETSPTNGATDVPVDNSVVVVFSETMDTATEPTLTQTLGTDPGGWAFSGWTTTTNPNDTATWTHSAWTGGDSVTMQVDLYRDNALNVGASSSWSFTVITAATWIKLLATLPMENMVPYDNAPDTNANVLTSTNAGTSWTVENVQPIFILDYSDATYEGNPYATSSGNSVYDINFVGENFTVSGSKRITGVSVYGYKFGSPPGNLGFTLENDSGVMENLTLMDSGSVPGTLGWVENTDISFTLDDGATYRFYLWTEGGDVSNCYDIIAPSAGTGGTGAPYQDTSYDGTNSFIALSTNGGASWNPNYTRDVIFTFTENRDDYEPEGYLQSSWYEPQPGTSVDWGSITFNRTLPSGTDENVYVQISDTSAVAWSASGGPYTSGNSIGLSGQYARYRVYLGTSEPASTPQFDDISLGWSSGGAGGSVVLRMSSPLNENMSYDNYVDDANVLYSPDGSSWTPRDNQPIYVLDVDTDSNTTVDAHEGNPYDEAGVYEIYGNDYAGAGFSVSGKTKLTRGVYVYVRMIGSPGTALNYTLYSISNATAIATGEAATATELPATWTWKYIQLESALVEGKSYRLYLSTSGGNASNRYEWMAPGRSVAFSATDYATYDGTNTYGTTSSNGGSNWTDNTQRDVVFRFEVADGIASSGWLESSVYNAGQAVDWTSGSTSSTGTSVTLKARTGDSPDPYSGGSPTVNPVYVSSEPNPLADSTSRVGGVTGGSYSNTQNQDGSYEQIAEGNVGSASYAYVSSQSENEGGFVDLENAQADDGNYENTYENDYGTAGSESYTYVSSWDNAKGTITNPTNQQDNNDGGAYATLSERLVGGAGGGPENRAVDVVDSADGTGDTLADAQSDDVSGASPSAVSGGDGWYTVDKGITGHFDSIDTSGMGGTISAATLWVQFSVEGGYDGTNPIEWATDEATFTSTGIVPADGDVDRTESYDLYAQGVDTISELEALDIRFVSNDGAGPDAVSFDYVWVETTWSGSSTYDMEIYENIASIPSADTYTLEMNCYRSNTNDYFHIEVWNGSAWNRPENDILNATSDTDWSYTLLGSEVISGKVEVRFVDNDSGATSSADLRIDWLRVKSTTTATTAYRENVQQNITGIAAAASYTLQVEYYTEGDSESVSTYVYNFTTTNWDNVGTLQGGTAVSPNSLSYSVDSDHISGGEVRVQFVQPDSDSTQTSLMIDYTRVASQPTEYQLNWEHNISGVTTGRDNENYTLKIYGRRGSDQSVSVSIRNFTTSSWTNVGTLATSDGWIEQFIEGANISNYLSGGAMSVRYYQGTSDATQTTIYLDQVVLEENYLGGGAGEWSGWTTNISSLSDSQYIQYRLELSTSDPSTTPVVHDVTINYQDVTGAIDPPSLTPTLQTWTQSTRADFLGDRASDDLHNNIELVVPGDVSLKANNYWGNEFPQSSTYSTSLRLNDPNKKISFRFNAQKTGSVSEVHIAAWNGADDDDLTNDADNITWHLTVETDDGNGNPSGTLASAGAQNTSFTVTRTWNFTYDLVEFWLSTPVVLSSSASLTQGNVYHIVIKPATGTLVDPSSTNWVNFNLSKPKLPDNNWINGVTTNQDRAVVFWDSGSWQEITDREPTYVLKYTDSTYEGNQFRKSTEILFRLTGDAGEGAIFEYTNYQGQKVTMTSDMTAAAVEFYVKPRVGDPGMIMVGLRGIRDENIESIMDLSTMDYSWVRATFDEPRKLWENDIYTVTIVSLESDPTNYLELVLNKNIMASSFSASEYINLTFGGAASCYVYGETWTSKSTYDIPFRFVTGYCENGTFESEVFDAGQKVDWQYIEWDATKPAGTQLKLRARVGDDSDVSGDWSDWITVSGSSLASLRNSRYIQYQAELLTDNNNKSPVLHEVRITYRGGFGSLRETTPTQHYPEEEHIHEGGAVIIAQDNKSVMYSPPDNFIAVDDLPGDDLKVAVNYHMLRSVTGTGLTMATMNTFDIFMAEEPRYTVENEHTDNVEIIILSDYAEAWEGYLNDVATGLRNAYPSYQNIAQVSSDLSEGLVMLTINGKYTDATNDLYYYEMSTECEVS